MSCLYLIFALPINHIKLSYQEYTENKCSMLWPCDRMYFHISAKKKPCKHLKKRNQNMVSDEKSGCNNFIQDKILQKL